MKNPKPTSCTIDLTEACNLACDYCFTWSKHKPRRLTSDMGHRIIDWWLPQTDEKQPVQIAWWGGEPLLEWDMLQELTYYARGLAKELDRKITFGGTTNGLLYTPDKVEWCVENDALFLVSLDGVQQAHDAHRKKPNGKGSWKIVDKNVREALKIAPIQRVRTSFSPDTIKYFYESILYFVEDLGIKNLAYSPVFEGDWNEEVLETTREQFDLVINYMIKRTKENDPIIIKHINDEAVLGGKDKDKIWNPCGAGNGYSGWSVDGYMFPCHRFNKHGISTEERSKLSTIIARPKGDSFEWCNQEWRNQFIQWKDNPPKQCINCNIFMNSVCNGGCYAVNFDMTNSLYKQPKSECDFNRIQHEASMKYAEWCKSAGVKVHPSEWEGKNNTEPSCICYNACYSEFIDKSDSLKQQHLKLCKRILQSYGESKSDKQIELEIEVISKTINFLERN